MNYFEGKDVKSIQNLDLLAKQVVEGFIIGLHKSPFHGFSVEFAEHRLYNPGESMKDIDWKVYARSEKMFVKRFEEETNLRCQIVIDTSSSMYFSKDEKSMNKLEFSAIAAVCLMNLFKRQRDAFGLSLFDDQVIEHTKCKSSTSHYQLLLTFLDRLIRDTKKQKATSAASALHQIADSIHKRSLVIIFSDMFDGDSEKLFLAIQHLKYAKHEVILFHVVDEKLEIDFEFDNRPYLFIDMEDGTEVKLQSNQVKELYQAKAGKYKEALKMKCLQYKVDFVEADINKGLEQILQAYLVKRNRMK
jgi:uncharacterized protein (DUF58 family)